MTILGKLYHFTKLKKIHSFLSVSELIFIGIFKIMEIVSGMYFVCWVLGIELWTSHMLGKCSSTELHPSWNAIFLGAWCKPKLKNILESRLRQENTSSL